VTVHRCTVRSPLSGCQVTSRPCDQLSRYSKWLETSQTALVSEHGTENNIVTEAKKGLLAKVEDHFRGSTDCVLAGKMANGEFSVLVIDY